MPFRIASKVVLAIVLLSLAGCYRYDKLGNTPVRTHRLTGKVERMTANGWQEMKPQVSPEPRELSTDELNKVRGKAQLDKTGTFSATIHNGNDFPITGIVFSVRLTDKDGNPLGETKLYRPTALYSSIGALGTELIIIQNMDIRTSKDVDFEWDVERAETTDH